MSDRQNSLAEEALAALHLIAAILAWNGGIKWLAWCLFVKAAADTVCAIKFAILHHRAEPKHRLSKP